MARNGRKVRKRGGRRCQFCPKPLGPGAKYIYPVPEPYEDPQFPSRVGKMACSKCAPDLIDAQFEQGLVVKGRVA